MEQQLLNDTLNDEDDQIFIQYCTNFYHNVLQIQDQNIRQQTLTVMRDMAVSTRARRRMIVIHINNHHYAAALRQTYNILIADALTMAINNPLHAFTVFDADVVRSRLLEERLPQILRVEIDHLYTYFPLPLIVRQLQVLDDIVRQNRYGAMAAQINDRRAQEIFLATYIHSIPYVAQAMRQIRGYLQIQRQIDDLLDVGIHVYNIIRLRGMLGNHFPGVVIPDMTNDDLLSQQRELQVILIYTGLQEYVAQHAVAFQPWLNTPQYIKDLIQDRIENDIDTYPRFRIINWQRYIEETLVPYYTHLMNIQPGGQPPAADDL